MTSRIGIIAGAVQGDAPPPTGWAVRDTNSGSSDILAMRAAFGNGKILVAGKQGVDSMFNYSADGGVTFGRSTGPASGIGSVTRGGSAVYGSGTDGDWFVTFWEAGAGRRIYLTPDLPFEAWSHVGDQSFTAMYDLCYDASQEIFLMTGRKAGPLPAVATSVAPATSWTQRNTGVFTLDTFYYCAGGNGVFVVADSLNAYRSTDGGVTWAAAAHGGDGIQFVAHNGLAGAAGLFAIAVDGLAPSGTTPRILTSPDGAVWTARNPGFANGDFIVGVAHNGLTGGSGIWLAICAGFAGYSFSTSPDAITWTPQNDATFETIAAECFGLSPVGAGRFAAFASIIGSGANRIATYG